MGVLVTRMLVESTPGQVWGRMVVAVNVGSGVRNNEFSNTQQQSDAVHRNNGRSQVNVMKAQCAGRSRPSHYANRGQPLSDRE